jgi:hypothetical protein
MWPTFGAFLFCGSVALMWFIRPREGREHKLLTMPFLGGTIPIGIVVGLTIGFTLILSGILR